MLNTPRPDASEAGWRWRVGRRVSAFSLCACAILAGACGGGRSMGALDASGVDAGIVRVDGSPPARDALVPDAPLVDAPITSGDGGRCGDGAVSGTEQCDDYNTRGGDGCDVSCAIEPGWGCAGMPSMCTPADCMDGVMNGGETAVDCGHVCPDRCNVGQGCAMGDDCRSAVCAADGTCAAPSCTDLVMNGLERDVDCGGGTCPGCADGLRCLLGSDCASAVCNAMARCDPPSCSDGVVNQGELDVDCLGPCPLCRTFQRCRTGADCVSGICEGDPGALACVVYPHLDSAEPPVGHSGERVLLHGTGFLLGPDPTVTFGSLATIGRAMSDTLVEVSAPARTGGMVDIVLTNWDGRASNPLPWRYIEPITFGAPVDVSMPGYHPDRIASANLDGDTDIDLVVADSVVIPDVATAVARVLTNVAGTFTPAASITFSANIADIALARLDADTTFELVAALSDGSMAVARGNGDGTFGVPVVTALGDRASSLVARDIDGDGTTDVAFAYSTLGIGYAAFLRGRGDRTFDVAVSVRLPSIGQGIDTLVVAAGETTEDIFVSTPTDVRRVQFSPLLPGWMDVPTLRVIERGGGMLAHADLEGDGDQDLFTGSQVWRNPGGYLTFGPSYPGAGGRVIDVGIADFDRDGLVDVTYVSLWESAVHVAVGEAAGGLRATAWTSPFLTRTTQAVEALDVDGDARADLVVGARDGLYVLRNTTP